MHRQRGSLPAVLVLVALALPWVGALAALAHNIDGHHHHAPADHHPSETGDLIVHGHQHEPGTPSHEHTFVLGNQAPLSKRNSLTVDTAPSVLPAPISPRSADIATALCADRGHGPPGASRTISILRI